MRAFLFLFLSFFTLSNYFGQNGNFEKWDQLIKKEQFDQLKAEFQQNDKSEYSYITFLRSKALNYSLNKEDNVAVNIMKHCCNLANNKFDDCDTVKLNNLHLLGRYYSFANELELSLQTNKFCLEKRLACEKIEPLDIAKSYNNIGLYFQDKKEHDSSLYYFELAYKYYKSRANCKTFFTNIIYSNYLLNLAYLGENQKGKRLLNEWFNISKKNNDFSIIIGRTERLIFECLELKNLEGGSIYNSINKKIHQTLYGKTSFEMIDCKMNFIKALINHDYLNLALKNVKKIDESQIKRLNYFNQLKVSSHISTIYMNLGFDSVALKKFTDVKTHYSEKYLDSGEYLLMLTNLSTCYYKLKDFENMKNTRREIYELYNKDAIRNNFRYLFSQNINRDLVYYTETENYDQCIELLVKAIEIYNSFGEIDKKIYYQSRLSNLYLFQKYDLNKSEILLNEIEKELTKLESPEKSLATYFFYKAEFLRSLGNKDKYVFYKKSAQLYDSIGFFPNEYFNAIKRIGEYNLDIGNFSEGKILLDKYLGETNYNNRDFFFRKIDYLLTLNQYQSDEINNDSTLNLLSQIDLYFGEKSAIYRRAANLLHSYIIDDDVRIEVLNKLISTFEKKTSLEYFYASSELAEEFFKFSKIQKSDSLWEKLFSEAKILKKEEFNKILLTYIEHLIFYRMDYKKSLELLQQTDIDWSDFETYNSNYYFNCFIGLKDYESAYKYLTEKEKYILKTFSENSEQYLELTSDFITYFEAIGNNILVKYYREKELEIIYVNQPNNKTSIVSKTYNLVSNLLVFGLFERCLYWVNRAKNKFNINFESTNKSDELFLLFYEQATLFNIFLLNGEYKITISDIKNNLIKIQAKCNELKNNHLQKDEANFLDILSKLVELIFKTIEDPSWKLRETNMYNFMSELQASSYFGKFIDGNSKIKTLINEGKYEEAKKQALLENDFSTLEELEWESGNEVMAFKYSFEEEKLEINELINASKGLTDIELEQKRKIQKNSLNFPLGRYVINLANPSNEIIEKSFELILNNYGLVSDLNKDFYKFLRNTDSEYRNQYNYLNKFKNQGLIDGSKRNENDDKLRDLEFKLNLKLLERKSSNLSWVTLQEIKKTLNDSDVYILNYKYDYKDFVGNSMNTAKQRFYYLTYIVSKSSLAPNLIITPFNPDNEADIVDYYYSGITKKGEKQDLSFIYEKIWAKIDEELPKKVKRVILSPDGMYNSINVSTLFDKNNNKYIFDKYEIVIADKIGAENNTNLSQLSSAINSAVLVGFPYYSGTTISDKQNTNDTLKLNLDKYYSNVTRGSIAKSLPGTKTEIEKINSQFVNNGIKTTVLMENNATEDNLKKVVSPDVLHIATHGFFINSKEGTPMLNSGLLLAGSNSKTKKIEDGYLSAYETSLLNLENTKLVVLSACETGRGVMKDGDGVFGLKQGCLNAGAQNIIMSLWKVDDKVTQEFMTRFYEIWLNDKTSIREAFNKTQLEIKAKYPQPYYWGAFILVGE